MPHPIEGIVVERTTMPDLANRMLDLLQDSRVHAWISSRAGFEMTREGACVLTSSWDVTVPETSAERARRVIAEARRSRRLMARSDAECSARGTR